MEAEWSPSRRAKGLLIGGVVLVVAISLGVMIVNLSSSKSSSDTASTTYPGVSLRAVDGGVDYYKKFADPLPTDPSYFPIGVYYASVGSQDDVDLFHNAGINTFVEIDSNADFPAVKGFIQKDNMKVIAVDVTSNGPETNGWALDDEADMNYAPGNNTPHYSSTKGTYCTPNPGCGYTQMANDEKKFPTDKRMRYTNYGKGVLFWDNNTDAAQFVNQYQDVLSADAYYFQDYDLCSFSQAGLYYPQSDIVNGELPVNLCHLPANYGKDIDKVRSLVSPAGSKPVWGIVELGHVTKEAPGVVTFPAPTVAQISAAVWSNLIHGARGIIYFNNAYGGCRAQNVLATPCYSAVKSGVTTLDAQITALAPVLNAPFADGVATASTGVDLSTKWYNGHFYVFAGSNQVASQKATFSLPCVGNTATVTVLNENRTIKMSGGTFTDTYADGNAYHLYRIDGGDSCGLKK
jgi:hypothetical protein